MTLPTDAKARKAIPIGTGVLDYFPDALAAVAEVARAGNEQHNPGQPLHWARGKSMDQWDTLVRHGLERGKIDSDGQRHSAKLAWRALALLQEELEAEGAPVSRGSKSVETITHIEIWITHLECYDCGARVRLTSEGGAYLCENGHSIQIARNKTLRGGACFTRNTL